MEAINDDVQAQTNGSAVTIADSEQRHVTLMELNYTVGVTYVLLAAILTVTGAGGNSVVLYITSRQKKMNEFAKRFIINKAVADLCVSLVANPMCIAGAILGMRHFEKNFWLCSLTASVCLTTCVCVFFNIANLAVNRYIFICHHRLYGKLYTTISVTSLCVASWVGGFLAELPNLIGWGGHVFDEKMHQCIWDRQAERSYTLMLTGGLMMPVFVLSGYCNVAILFKIWGVKGAIGMFNTTERNALLQTIRSAKTVIALYVGYLVCWAPYIVVLLVDHGNRYSTETYLFVTLLAHSHSTLPFLIYVGFSRSFILQLKMCFRKTRANSIHPMPYDIPKAAPGTSRQKEPPTPGGPSLVRQVTLGPMPIATETSIM